MDEFEKILEDDPEASAELALRELHYGRLDWLAEHIRRCDFQISRLVVKHLLEMIEGTGSNCRFELRAVRRSDLPPRSLDPEQTLHRNAEIAIEVARRCGFKRGHIKRACHDVGLAYNLTGEYVAKQIRPFRQMALDVVEEERMQEAYEQREVDFLGRSK